MMRRTTIPTDPAARALAARQADDAKAACGSGRDAVRAACPGRGSRSGSPGAEAIRRRSPRTPAAAAPGRPRPGERPAGGDRGSAMTRTVLLAGALLAVTACGLLEDFGADAPAPATAGDPAAELLASAALRAEAALAELAQARAAESPIDATPPPALVPQELLTEVRVDWTGPLDTLVRRLAEEAGWDFIVAGPEPPRPPIVEIHATSAPIILILRDAGIQAAETAAVTVDARARQVRIDWPANQGAPI